MNKKAIWIVIVILLIALLFVIINTKKSNPNTIKIGVAVGLTGYASNWGEGEVKAIELAFDEYKDRLPNIEFVIENTKSDGLGTVNTIKKLVEVDKVNAIIGPTWGDSFQGGYPIATKANIPVITPSAAFEALAIGSRKSNMFSTWWPQTEEAKTILNHMISSSKKKIVVFHDQDAFNTSFSNLFEITGKAISADFRFEKIVAPIGTKDFRTYIAKLSSSNPDAILVLFQDTSTVGPLMKQLKELNVKSAIYSTTSAENGENVEKFPGLFDGLVYSFPSYVNDKKYQEVHSKFVEKYGMESSEGPAFVNAYNAGIILFESLLDNNDNLTQSIQKIKIPGIGASELSFDENGQLKNASFIMKKIENNKFVEIK